MRRACSKRRSRYRRQSLSKLVLPLIQGTMQPHQQQHQQQQQQRRETLADSFHLEQRKHLDNDQNNNNNKISNNINNNNNISNINNINSDNNSCREDDRNDDEDDHATCSDIKEKMMMKGKRMRKMMMTREAEGRDKHGKAKSKADDVPRDDSNDIFWQSYVNLTEHAVGGCLSRVG
ncbi:hypothetical protein HELRODRAFT_181771 [Helobdella robusta]|uniref:Uncharacterized protein n=1 Tax=Helobdella robusta TaxID=6412 RepID=T1FHB0_HELRO|nr:hypothetical protein HELRODRAFT_181771 [Helobdella robusta]ESN92150.1 hypothetical protein HELRODRAFT_181771 [Helobdella robusta]